MLTVTTKAATHDLTRVEVVKLELGIADDDHDALLKTLIGQASAASAAYCRRVFAAETVSETFRPERALDALVLARRPVSVLTSVTEDGVALTTLQYEADAEAALLYRLDSDARSTWPPGKIVVVYTGGYALLDELPRDIERACVLLVKSAWFARARDPLTRQEAVDGVGSNSYWVGGIGEGGLPPDVTALLDPYRNFAV